MEQIKISNVSKCYRIGNNMVKALDYVSVTINKGEYVAIRGKSGSGKSTLLNVIGLTDKPSEGAVLFDDRDVSGYSNKDISVIRNKEIGYIFQSFYLEPTYSVRMNVEMPLLIANVSAKERKNRVADVLGEVGLASKINNKAYELSGGERQRACIARALVNNPDIILADEPCGNLDSENSDIVLGLLSELNRQGKTIVLVTHSEEDAKNATRTIFMKDGKIIE